MNGGIGGYFELEMVCQSSFPHDDGVLLNSGRNALEYVLRSFSEVRHLWVPYYTCDVVLEPLEKLHISYSFYRINLSLELQDFIPLKKGEYLLYTNYFGIKDGYVRMLANHYGSQLIVDNAQAWFTQPIEQTSSIYSPRKYIGIPDGGIAYCQNGLNVNLFEQDYSFDRCSHLLKRIDSGASEGYDDFKVNSRSLCNQPIRRMSKLTKTLLSSIEFETVKKNRLANFNKLHEALKASNRFVVPEISSFKCPMIYPYFTDDHGLRQKLIDNKIYVATYWPNVREWVTEDSQERELVEKLLPIPCDQRYDENAMQHIIAIINR